LTIQGAVVEISLKPLKTFFAPEQHTLHPEGFFLDESLLSSIQSFCSGLTLRPVYII